MYHAYWNFHSDYVQIAAERGFLTLAAWLWFEIAYLVFLFRLLARARRQNQFATMIVVGVLSGFVAFLFPSLVESALNDDALVMLLQAAGFAVDHLATHDVFEPTLPEAADFIARNQLPAEFRGDDIFVLARHTGKVTDRWPEGVYV